MISVIGYKGVVGSATYQLFKNLGYDVTGADKGDEIKPSEMHFICVPEGNVEEVIRILPAGLAVIRSSVPPLTTEHLSRKYQRHICHNPEFLRQAMALLEAHNPDSVVIGECCEEHGKWVEELYRPLCCPIVRTDPSVSEMVKLTRNNWGAVSISFWNEVEALCKKIGINGHKVGMIAAYSPYVSEKGSRLHKKYGGACLPKDMQQTIKFAHSVGINMRLMEVAEEINNTLEDV